ncbi:unnamed protein product [Musa acuminata subsp. malaccensis]|uniref:(wild Malaysian banana) hypothetical protein n=1 Tax=Musa acuminata subsp. malaccensis TaxID=214687 RepID=A0A804KYL2_MUSAM|nr:unnamed protein product [Musa acuminata subsp. malaccensis]
MLMGTLVYGIKYTIPEYICTFLVAGGVSSFALSKVRWFPLFPDVGKFLTIVYQLKQILANTTITTTRKFVSIVVSSLISGNPLSPKHWASVVMVFSGLSLQIFLKWRKIQRTKKGRKAT